MRWPQPQDFFVGANLPWLSYGDDFGANAWHPDGGVGRPAQRFALRAALSRVADEGLTHVRWFVLCDGRAGLRTAPDGSPVGLDDFVFRDGDAAVEELARAGLFAIFVLFDFHWFKPAAIVNGVQTCGRARFAVDPRLRARLFDGVVAPLLDRYGRHASIAAWDVINEPEWVTRGGGGRPSVGRVQRPAMRAFIGECVGLVHGLTSHAATVGSASTRSLALVRDLGLDVYQAHWYDRLNRHAPLDLPVPAHGLDRPLILGEFPTRGSRRTSVDILDAARRAGYAGALAWSVLADDEASDGNALARALTGPGAWPARPGSTGDPDDGCYYRGMDRHAILAFARRDWSMVADAKTRHWIDRKRDRSAADLLAVGDQLRRYACAVRPDWPTDAERAADLAVHARVTEALRAVSSRPR